MPFVLYGVRKKYLTQYTCDEKLEKMNPDFCSYFIITIGKTHTVQTNFFILCFSSFTIRHI